MTLQQSNANANMLMSSFIGEYYYYNTDRIAGASDNHSAFAVKLFKGNVFMIISCSDAGCSVTVFYFYYNNY